MRDDQVQRLQALSEDLAEVVIEELDPNAWPGAGKPLAEITKDERGDRYWCKKNAAATMTLLLKVVNINGIMSKQKPGDDPGVQTELDAELAAAEREAAAILERIQKGGHVH